MPCLAAEDEDEEGEGVGGEVVRRLPWRGSTHAIRQVLLA